MFLWAADGEELGLVMVPSSCSFAAAAAAAVVSVVDFDDIAPINLWTVDSLFSGSSIIMGHVSECNGNFCILKVTFRW